MTWHTGAGRNGNLMVHILAHYRHQSFWHSWKLPPKFRPRTRRRRVKALQSTEERMLVLVLISIVVLFVCCTTPAAVLSVLYSVKLDDHLGFQVARTQKKPEIAKMQNEIPQNTSSLYLRPIFRFSEQSPTTWSCSTLLLTSTSIAFAGLNQPTQWKLKKKITQFWKI